MLERKRERAFSVLFSGIILSFPILWLISIQKFRSTQWCTTKIFKIEKPAKIMFYYFFLILIFKIYSPTRNKGSITTLVIYELHRTDPREEQREFKRNNPRFLVWFFCLENWTQRPSENEISPNCFRLHKRSPRDLKNIDCICNWFSFLPFPGC